MVIKLHDYIPVDMADDKGILCSNAFITLLNVYTIVCKFDIPDYVFHDKSFILIHDRNIERFNIHETLSRTECQLQGVHFFFQKGDRCFSLVISFTTTDGKLTSPVNVLFLFAVLVGKGCNAFYMTSEHDNLDAVPSGYFSEFVD